MKSVERAMSPLRWATGPAGLRGLGRQTFGSRTRGHVDGTLFSDWMNGAEIFVGNFVGHFCLRQSFRQSSRQRNAMSGKMRTAECNLSLPRPASVARFMGVLQIRPHCWATALWRVHDAGRSARSGRGCPEPFRSGSRATKIPRFFRGSRFEIC